MSVHVSNIGGSIVGPSPSSSAVLVVMSSRVNGPSFFEHKMCHKPYHINVNSTMRKTQRFLPYNKEMIRLDKQSGAASYSSGVYLEVFEKTKYSEGSIHIDVLINVSNQKIGSGPVLTSSPNSS
jgi:hypothetical protein